MSDSLQRLPLAGRSDSSSDDVRRRITATRIRTAIGVMPRNASAGIVGVIIGLLGMSPLGAGGGFQLQAPVLGWGAATLLSISASIALAIRFNRSRLSDEAAIRIARRQVAAFTLTGLCWGSSAWLLLPASSFEQDAFLLAGISMVLMGGAGAQAVYRPLVLGFSIPLTLVFVSGLARLGDPMHELLAGGFTVYAVVVLMYARNQERAVTMAIELGLENEVLLGERTEQERQAQLARSVAEQARELAEKADRSKTSFIAATSHDLRQPMHALVQYVEHLRRTCSDPRSGPTIAKIEDSVSAMENLLNAVLDFSQISMGAIKPRIEIFPIEHLLHSVDTQIRPLAQAKGLNLRVESEGGYIESDEVLLERVIRNIAQNAVRYTESGAIVVRAVCRHDKIRVLVSDSGIGVSSAEQERIFDEYYQIDNRERDRRKGLGLGLAIVRDLARLLELRIRLRSAPGRGSTFAIEVRRGYPPERDQAGPRDGRRVDFVRGAFVVLIDDDPLALDGLATTLRDFGCRVLAAASGLEALHTLVDAEFAPQLLISDYRLAGDENGLDAIAMIVENQRALYGDGFVLPALLITGDTSPEELQRVAAAGHAILHKPVGTRRLFETLDSILQTLADRERA